MQWIDKILKTKFPVARWFPFAIAGVVVLAVILWEVFEPAWVRDLSSGVRILLWVSILCISLIACSLFLHYLKLFQERKELETRLKITDRSLLEAYERMEAIFQVNQKFVDASDENEVVAPALQVIVNLLGARGASFVPLDEHGQPQSAASHGELPESLTPDWIEYLASPDVRERCGHCENYDVLCRPSDCPLLAGPFADADGLLCLAVKRGEREFGVLNIFLADQAALDDRTRTFLRALIEEMALGLDSISLRRNELSALRHMQRIRQKTDLQALLSGLLENVHRSLEADVAVMSIPSADRFRSSVDLMIGDLAPNARSFVEGILQGVMASGDSALFGDVTGDPAASPGLRSLMAVPLVSSDRQVVGGILVGNWRARRFSQRQLALLQTIAGQVTLVVQNANLMAELEYKTMIQERTRLAREIHDGLAQTLGFLKLQVGQMRNYYVRGEYERLRKNLDMIYSAINDAYLDVRQSIDGLRISPDGDELAGWLNQTVQEFEELSGLMVTTNVELQEQRSPEVHAQLVRILQEALSNIRKHSGAQRVWVDCHDVDGDLVLEVRDDGIGFLPEDVAGSSRHGLRGMRERSDLIGADFQVISQPKNGTTIRVRMPHQDLEGYQL